MLKVCLFIISIVPALCLAQNFEAHLSIGLNASQIDGDLFSGYNKLGIHTGIGIAYDLKTPWSLNTGIFYDVLGSQKELQLGNSAPEEQQKITLRYISVPLSLGYSLLNVPLTFSGGFKYSYLINSQIRDRTDEPILSFFNESDVAVFLKMLYKFNSRWSLSIKASESINLIFNNNKVKELNSSSLRNRHLTFSFNRHL